MPSLQNQVDDNLVCGQWGQRQARQRRREIEHECDRMVATRFLARLLFSLNGLALAAALAGLCLGTAWRSLSQEEVTPWLVATGIPCAIGLSGILPLGNLLLSLSAGANLALRSSFSEQWGKLRPARSTRTPWLCCGLGLLGWWDLAGLMLALLSLCAALLLSQLRQEEPSTPVEQPLPLWYQVAFVVPCWQVLCLAYAGLTLLLCTSQLDGLRGWGQIILDDHPRLLPFLGVPLLLAHNRIREQAQRIAAWNRRFRNESVIGIEMQIETDLLYGSHDRRQAGTMKDRLRQEADLLEWISVQMSRASRLNRIGLLFTLLCLLVGAVWHWLALGQEAAVVWGICAGPLMATALVLTLSNLLFTTALELRLASPFRYLKRCKDAPLAEHGKVRESLGSVVAEICLAWLGLPVGLSLATYTLWRCRANLLPEQEKEKEKEKETPATALIIPRPERIRIEVGSGLRDLAKEAVKGNLLALFPPRGTPQRMELGMPLPPIAIVESSGLPRYGLRVHLAGRLVLESTVLQRHALAYGCIGGLKDLDCIRAGETVYGDPSFWVERERRYRAYPSGVKILSAHQAFQCYLCQCLLEHAHLWLEHSDLVAFVEMYGRAISLPRRDSQKGRVLLAVFKTLLDEQVPLGDMETLSKAFERWYEPSKETSTEHVEALVEQIRLALATDICRQCADATGELNVLEVTLPPEHETQAQIQLLAIMGRQLEILADLGLTPVALVRAQDRRRLRRLTRLSFPDLMVLSREEVVLPINVLDVTQAGPAHG